MVPERPLGGDDVGDDAAEGAFDLQGRVGDEDRDDVTTETSGQAAATNTDDGEWSPAGFFRHAVRVTHPCDAPFELAPGLRDAVRFWTRQPVDEAAAIVRADLDFWWRRARALEHDEAVLHASLDPGLSSVLCGKRLLLLDEIATDIQHPDAKVIHELAAGFALAGPLPASGAFPPRGADSEVIGEGTRWLDDRAGAVQIGLLDALRAQPLEAEIASAVAEATAKEIAAGWVQGPFSVDELVAKVGPLWLPARRFGVKQGSKVRPIDDLSKSLVNASVSVVDMVTPDGVDAVVAVARLWAEELGELGAASGSMGPLGGKTFDLEAAYRQCAVRPDHRRYSVFAYEPPAAEGGRFLYLANALPFGGSASVVQFNRVARFFRNVLLKLLRLPAIHYYDDYPIMIPFAMWSVVGGFVREVAELTGFRWKASSVEGAFSEVFGVLGVTIDLRGALRGELGVSNTQRRTDELCDFISGVLVAGFLSPAAAAMLAGRLGFAGAQAFGKSGVAHLGPVRAAGRAGAPVRVRGQLEFALRWWRLFLRSAGPRLLHLWSAAPPLTVFTDGACEESLHGVGAVIADQAARVLEAFGCRMPDEVVHRLFAVTGSRQIIAQLELAPVLFALWRWAARFRVPGRRVIFFIDNDAARYGLIRGSSPVAASRALIEAIWRELARCQAAAWFARVPSRANPADGPSRLDFSGLAELSASASVVDAPEVAAPTLSLLELG